MSDRPCPQCIWRGVDGCTNWDCEPVTRSEARKRLHGWTSVIDRLPEKPGFYLVTKRQRSGQLIVAIGHYSGEGWSGSGNFSDVTHWMPLPEPLKEVQA